MKVTGQNVNRTIGNLDTSKTDKAHENKTNSSLNPSSAKSSPALDASSKINVSERAQAMQKAKDIASDSSIDEAKVARLQKLIDAGEYRVDSGAVADRLVDDHLLFPE